MTEYQILDAAVDSVRNYMKALDAEPSEVTISIHPYFNTEGYTERIRYNLHLADADTTADFEMEQRFSDLHERPGEEYPLWVEQFVRAFPAADLNYHSTVLSPHPVINDAVDTVNRFLDAFSLDSSALQMMIDPAYDEALEVWSIDYHLRTTTDKKQKLDLRDSLAEFDEERIKGEIYPLLISTFEQEFPEADMDYPEVDELDERT